MHRSFGRLHRVKLVVDRRRWAGQVVDLVDLDIKRERYIVPKDFETRMADQMGDVVLGAAFIGMRTGLPWHRQDQLSGPRSYLHTVISAILPEMFGVDDRINSSCLPPALFIADGVE